MYLLHDLVKVLLLLYVKSAKFDAQSPQKGDTPSRRQNWFIQYSSVTPAHHVLVLFLSITFSQCRSFVVLSVSRKNNIEKEINKLIEEHLGTWRSENWGALCWQIPVDRHIPVGRQQAMMQAHLITNVKVSSVSQSLPHTKQLKTSPRNVYCSNSSRGAQKLFWICSSPLSLFVTATQNLF